MSAQTSQQELHAFLLDLLPPQGSWTEDEYLWITDRTNRMLEFADGTIVVLPPPTREHQTILGTLLLVLCDFLGPRGGEALFAPLRMRLSEGGFCQPDLLAVLDTHDPRAQDRYWTGADLVVEVVSPDAPERDLVEKRREYAGAGITEYWIVDPRDRSVTVLTLVDDQYREHGRFMPGQEATCSRCCRTSRSRLRRSSARLSD